MEYERKWLKANSAFGFTLIELLVVIFIVSIVTSVALFSFSKNDNQLLKNFTVELSQYFNLAQDRALLGMQVLGFGMNQDQFFFLNLEQDTDHSHYSWRIMKDKVLGIHKIPKNLAVRLELAFEAENKKEQKPLLSSSSIVIESDDNQQKDEETSLKPSIFIYANRDLTPFTLYIGKINEAPRYILQGYEDGSLEIKSLGD